jgi:nitroreductase
MVADMNEVLDQLNRRKSMRAFESRKVDESTRELLLQAAFQAPTAGNQMLYTILDVTDDETKLELADLCDHQPFIATAPVVYIFLADGHRWLETYRAAGIDARLLGPGDALLAMADAVIAAQNMVVAAESLGLGSCYIGDILENREQVRTLLGFPEDVFPAAMLVLGWPTERQKERRKPARFDGEYIVFENSYRVLSPVELKEMYRRQEEKSGRVPGDFDAKIRAFCSRKYESDFALELNRSAGEYLKAFGTGLPKVAGLERQEDI